MQEIPQSISSLSLEFPNIIVRKETFQKIENIYETSNCVIYQATDSRDQKIVQIKEYNCENFTKTDEEAYCREIYLQRKCNHRFITQLLGYSTHSPYIIVTEYFPNGVISDKLYRNNNKLAFSGTHLSAISLTITHALNFMHNLGIIHGNISNTSINLDKINVSRLPNFTFSSHNNILINNRPITCLAPETINNNQITTKSDIFSLGFIFYEFAEGKNPFSDKSNDEVVEIIKNPTQYLRFKKANQNIQNLIRECWSINPNDRPDAIKIFNSFASGQIYFDKTNTKRIYNISLRISQNYQARTVDDSTILQNLELPDPPERFFDFYKEDISQEFEIDESLISNPSQQYFIENITEIAKSINDNTAKRFYELTSQFTTPKYAIHIRQLVLKLYFKAMSYAKKLIDICYDNEFYFHLPATDDFINYSIDITAALFIYRPEIITTEFFESLKILMERKPNEILTIYSMYLRVLPSIHVSYHPIMFIFQNYQYFMKNNSSCITFIRLINELLENNAVIRQSVLSYITRIVKSLLSTTFVDVITETYLLLMKHRIEFNDYDLICKNLSMKEQNHSLFQFLLFQKGKYPESEAFASHMVNWAQVNPYAQIVLCYFAKQSENSAQIVSKNPIWLEKSLVDPYGAFTLMLIVLKYKSCAQILLKYPQMPIFLTRYLMTREAFVLCTVSKITQTFIKSEQIFNLYEDAGFFNAYFSIANESNEKSVGESSMNLIRYLIQFRFSISFVQYYNAICRFLAMQNELSASAIATIVALTKNPLGVQSLAPLKLESYFNSLLQIPEYNSIASEFFANMGLREYQ